MARADLAIEFWFDFSSAYAYLASREIEPLGRRVGARVLWRPFMLGAAFKVTGARGLSSTPLKAEYARRDWARAARKMGVALALPEGHPAVSLAAMRAFYWIEQQRPEEAAAFAHRVFTEYYQNGVDTADVAAMAALAAAFGFHRDAAEQGIVSEPIKRRAVAASDEALRKGVFGSPFFFVGEEPFWGWDRMAMMEAWIGSSGW